MTFEEILAKMTELSASLESGSLSLEQGIDLYNQGLELSKKAIAMLQEAKGKITLLGDELGKLAETAFEVDDDDQ